MIFDENDLETFSAALRVAPGGQKEFTLKIECRAGYFLSATDAPAGVTIEAKPEQSAPFTDIAAAPLDLSPFDGTTRRFYFRVSAAGNAPPSESVPSIVVAR